MQKMTRPIRTLTSRFARWDAESGQALVELSLSMGLLFFMLLGVVELAQVAYMSIEVSNAAKAAVQYGAQNSISAADEDGMLQAAKDDAANLPSGASFTATVERPSGSPKGTPECSCFVNGTMQNAPAEATCSSTICGGYVAQVLTVTTAASYTPLIHVPGIGNTFTIRGRAQQVVLR